MADCFWTDFVGCEEDCGSGPPPAAAPAYMDCQTSNSNVGHVTFYPDPDAATFTGAVTVVHARLWRQDQGLDFGACNWTGYIINASGQVEGDTAPDNGFFVAHTFKPESYFSATGTLYEGDVGVLATNNGDGTYTISLDALMIGGGFDNSGGDFGGGTIVLDLLDSTGAPYVATGIYSTCF